MSSLISKNVNSYINTRRILILTFLSLAWAFPALALEVDVSRRVKAQNSAVSNEVRWPASSESVESFFTETPVQEIFNSVEPSQSIVVLHTEQGFLPETIRLRKDGNYRIVVVNVNEKIKNASFILDAFGQTLGTYFGRPKEFPLMPKINGIFTFLSAESGYQGKIVVFSDKESLSAMATSNKTK